MLSMHRLIIAVAVALCVLPAAAQARPGFVPPSSGTSASPAVHYGHPHTSIKLDQVSPDARYGVPDATPPAVVAVPRTEVVGGRRRLRLGRRHHRRWRRADPDRGPWRRRGSPSARAARRPPAEQTPSLDPGGPSRPARREDRIRAPPPRARSSPGRGADRARRPGSSRGHQDVHRLRHRRRAGTCSAVRRSRSRRRRTGSPAASAGSRAPGRG